MRSGADHARALPVTIRPSPGSFVSEVRRLFSADEIRTHLERLEREETEKDAETRDPDEYEVRDESPAGTAERVRQFDTIKDLLTADTLGTS